MHCFLCVCVCGSHASVICWQEHRWTHATLMREDGEGSGCVSDQLERTFVRLDEGGCLRAVLSLNVPLSWFFSCLQSCAEPR